MPRALVHLVCGGALLVGVSSGLVAQQTSAPRPSTGSGAVPSEVAGRAFTAADYARAERFMTYNTTPLVLHTGVRATWLPDDRFWYRTTTEKGNEAFLIDSAGASRSTCELPACKAPASGGRGGG